MEVTLNDEVGPQHPFAPMICREYVPVDTTVIDEDVNPLDHEYPEAPVAELKVTLPHEGVLAYMPGGAGSVRIVT